MPPSFGVKYPFALKLFPNYNYFLQAVASKALHAIATINPASRLLRWGHLINTSGYLLQPLTLWPFPPPLKNSSAPPSSNPGESSPNTQGSSQGLQMASISEIPQVSQHFYPPASLFWSATYGCSWFSLLLLSFPRPLGVRFSSLCPNNLAWFA